ncbi:hypothetical protein BGAL_0049g00240 [Botrytis galanthina]|uniref:Uncharacterized protein n=1 Tax=Botrytis galanthina TaxID=278940 RepID=A0A4S8RG07_9HELO|nr:hypothetical protein BGAL_0049g00240 [Botrytis galanthina]
MPKVPTRLLELPRPSKCQAVPSTGVNVILDVAENFTERDIRPHLIMEKNNSFREWIETRFDPHSSDRGFSTTFESAEALMSRED